MKALYRYNRLRFFLYRVFAHYQKKGGRRVMVGSGGSGGVSKQTLTASVE